MTSGSYDRKSLLAEAALLTVRAYRDDVLIRFLDGQVVRLQNLSWSHDDGESAEVIGNVADAQSLPQALRFFTNEIAEVSDPVTGERIFGLPDNLRSP